MASFLFTDEKILTVVRLTECICSHQEERRCDKTPVHKINVQSLTASVGKPQVVHSTPVSVDTCRSRS